MKVIMILTALIVSSLSQRPPYAGKRPIGYPAIETTPSNALDSRFGEDDATTMRLPIEALGDADLVRRLSKLPVDKQPFWLLNWRALEDNRKNPQTYQQKDNVFINTRNTLSRR